ncbi:putative mycofactocin system creatinine amidohydrolase family protein MftE [Mycolicibacterium murale]|uniref:Putative mycofactocin system creatinine amidohydrolase family protein MftE n=1 Tax=Mycolicibacterium murale TaxID=182220 RepID=A0A7I9WVA7_9MYCO|nr:mycofactocin biosynthesis peptidyl-dipeptidase MftE [Mycolicibacterium murale]MCV7185812.1 mycofactocin biosynthesis peptidyl-dipeptidase MftE [Mycolicibacterium murale]GFG61320.1 putative mycofactocin system creatinine amidohydrolase family protein MftE [Mycolicibacterium murale]
MNSAYHRHVPHRSELGSSTSGQLHQFSSAVLVPVGSCEQHGPHLPLDTDTRIAAAVSSALAQRHPGYLVAPPVAYGASGEHESFPGTVSIGQDALHGVLVEFGRSACRWAPRVLLVNGHGGNVGALRSATRLLRYEGRDVAWSSCSVPGGDAHAGHTETSVLLYLSPSDVLMDRTRPGNSAPLAELMPRMRHGGVAAVSEVGVLGDPTTATAVDGARLFDEMVTVCSERVTRWSPDADGMLR